MNWESLNDELTHLRKDLHKHPELAGQEKETSQRIVDYAKKYSPDKIVSNIGGYGVAVIFEGIQNGPTILIRCDLDGLPIEEENDFEHKSVKENVSHKCGHDGHMSIVSGLIPLLSQTKINRGRVVLLYQPAEETGQGAERVLDDDKFKDINPDYVFALHNLPSFNINEIIVREKEFAAASKGLIIRLIGKTAHAAHPDEAISPSLAIAKLIQKLNNLNNLKSFSDFVLITIIHAKIGERAFGTTPGYAELMATLRTFKNDDMEILASHSHELIKSIALENNLKYTIEWVEEFPATVNNNNCVQLVRDSAKENNFSINEIETPFKWSEDFGHFTSNFNGALFGIGSGKDTPPLHNPKFDFPDEIILTGTKMFYSIIKNILEKE